MYSIAVIDDEPLIRESIIKSIDWESMGCRIILEDSSVAQVMHTIEIQNIDILFLDINIPGVDGLTFAEELKEKHSLCKVIIISAYKQFEFIQKALKIGVEDYIAKPIKNDELVLVVKKTIQRIEEERVQQIEQERLLKENSSLHQYMKNTKELIENSVIRETVYGKMTVEKMNQTIPFLPQIMHCFCLIGIRCIFTEIEQMEKVKSKLLSYFNNKQYNEEYIIKGITIDRDIILCMGFNEGVTKQTQKIYCHQMIDLLRDQLPLENSNNCFWALSHIYNKNYSMKEAYDEIQSKINEQFFRLGGISSSAQDRVNNGEQAIAIIAELNLFYNAVIECFNSPSEKNMEEDIERLFLKIRDYSLGKVDIAKAIVIDVCVTIIRFYTEYNVDILEEQDVEKVFKEIKVVSQLDKAKDYVKELIVYCLEYKKECSSSPIVTKALQYISSHFSTDISLQSVADYIGINASYLSRLLKKETTQTFSEILSHERLHLAKNLLKDPRLRLNEIAFKIGYKDYAYFYQTFKKAYGITPMEYRNSKQRI